MYVLINSDCGRTIITCKSVQFFRIGLAMKSSSSLRRCAGPGCASGSGANGSNGAEGGGAGATGDAGCATQATINRGRKAVIRMLGS